MDEQKIKSFINAMGAMAEITLLFYRSIVNAGATQQEAYRLMRAFIAAEIFGDFNAQ